MFFDRIHECNLTYIFHPTSFDSNDTIVAPTYANLTIVKQQQEDNWNYTVEYSIKREIPNGTIPNLSYRPPVFLTFIDVILYIRGIESTNYYLNYQHVNQTRNFPIDTVILGDQSITTETQLEYIEVGITSASNIKCV